MRGGFVFSTLSLPETCPHRPPGRGRIWISEPFCHHRKPNPISSRYALSHKIYFSPVIQVIFSIDPPGFNESFEDSSLKYFLRQ